MYDNSHGVDLADMGRTGMSGAARDLAGDPLQGLRVLVVEDEAMISLALADMLSDMGCVVVGNASRIGQALASAERLTFDAAVLDINLDGERVDRLADTLAARHVPVVFATGYGSDGVAPRFSGSPIVYKPYTPAQIAAALRTAVADR